MFTAKQTQLFSTKKRETSAKPASANPFVQKALSKQAETLSGNGALKYSTTGMPFVDQFGKLGSYKVPRTFQEVEKDCEELWAIDSRLEVMFGFYIRMITRTVELANGEKTTVPQKGAELRHEGIMRLLWLHNKSPKTFWQNIGIFVSIGSWKDIVTMLQYDLIYHGWEGRKLDWNRFGQLIMSGLNNERQSELVKKFLPTIQTTANATTVEAQADTMIGKWIASLLFGPKGEQDNGKTYRLYRKLKSEGTAHQWQQLISQGKHNLINFDKIHGRALNLLARSKYLKNQGLESKYEAWITDEKTEAKFTGFVHELFAKLPYALSELSRSERETINKQFITLVEKGRSKTHETSLIVVRDTSGSMGSQAAGTNMTCYDIAKALALYFSEFLSGEFANNWIEFNSDAKMHTWNGKSALERWYNDHSNYVGSTNFESVIKLFAKIKKEGVAECDFPTGILCISDSEFNPASLGQTNVESALNILRHAGFSDEYVNNFVIVLWNLQNSYYGNGSGSKFETYGNVPNVYYFSGYSAATVSFLTDDIKNAGELFAAAMNQEVLNMITLK